MIRGRWVIFFCFFATSGCATTKNFDSIPVTENDFSQSLTEIRHEYSDVALFEDYFRGFPHIVGNIDQLKEKWGEPQNVEILWWQKIVGTLFGVALVVYASLPAAAFFGVEAFFIYPQEKYHWEKGGTHVEARITRSGFNGYNRKIVRWEWEKCADTAAYGSVCH